LSTPSDDPRLEHWLARPEAASGPARVSIVGFAVDQGVARNAGRPGASAGPRAIRERLWRMCPDAEDLAPFVRLLESTRDLGDVAASGDLEADQRALSEVVANELARGAFVIVLGGGHETTYGHFLGYARAQRAVAIRNIDAHPDVRPLRDGLGHSGSPFRQALEHPSGLCESYRVEGLQPSATARAHLTYLAARGARFGFRRRFDPEALYDAACDTLATFCLDAVDQAFAPGVSAPSTDGLLPAEWLRAAYLAGASPRVASADVVELNPAFDRDGQTARLAARTVWELLRGLAAREAPSARGPRDL
jgi:formiminoglutamase